MQRGEIYWLPFGEPIPVVDEETGEAVVEDGKHVLETKKRPVIVVSRDNLNNGNYVVVVPCYSQQVEKRKQFPQNVHFHAGQFGLQKECIACTDQITYIDKKLIDWKNDKIGRVDVRAMQQIVKAIRWAVRDDDLPQ